MSPRIVYRWLCGLTTLSFSGLVADAAPGDLDASFGVGGRVAFELADASFNTTDMLIQPDGKIVVYAATPALSTATTREIMLVRYDASGNLDPAFNRIGYKFLEIPGGRISVGRLARQADGKFIVTATQTIAPDNSDIIVLRLHPDGALDTSFGSDGVVRVSFGQTSLDVGALVEIQAAGAIVLAGMTNVDGSSDIAFARLTAAGLLDASFGNQGQLIVDSQSGVQDFVGALMLQSDGKIVAAGWRGAASPDYQPVVIRLTASGQLDPSFDGDGILAMDVQPTYRGAFVSAVAQQADGKLLLGGTVYLDSSVPAILRSAIGRLTSNGAIDNPIATIDVGNGQSRLFDLKLDSDGKFIAVGLRLGVLGYAVRYLSPGVVDASFGTNGVASVSFGRDEGVSDFYGLRVSRQGDGKYVILGNALQGEGGPIEVTQNRGLKLVRLSADNAAASGVIELLGGFNSTLNEGTTATFTVARTGGGSGVVTADYSLLPVTATPGVDYTPQSGTMIWLDGDTTNRTITVAVLNDGVYESLNEELRLQLTNITGGALGGSASRRIFIRNVDNPAQATVSLGHTTLVRYEDTGGPGLSVPWTFRSPGLAAGATVDYTLIPGTATPGVDYPATGGTISVGVGFGFFAIPIPDDALDESPETFTVRLSNPVGAVIGQGETQVTIIDNDVPSFVEVRETTRVVSESAANIVFTVTRTAHSVGEVTIDYTTTSGSASGADFLATNGSLTWAADDAAPKTITVTLLGDNVIESNETFSLVLSNPTGGALLGHATAVATIVDDDTPIPPPATPAPSGGDRGGGRVAPLLLAALVLLAWLQCAKRRRLLVS